ncbi:hypothetical protein TCAL_15713 [Tigriopus californicus]|uniref:Reverse transcriptase domain-containing protein n=1 Tax=Tigriopus californicus TaxID=6832 RepID=A0A553P6Y4_TIGCA|nr:hypothetical protein TCAL_15713 [Tigriopus californicus]
MTQLHFKKEADKLEHITCTLRLVTNYRQLNKAAKRPLHPFSSGNRSVKTAWFVKLDVVHGYFQVSLDESNSMLTAFLLPSGKCRHTVAPMSLNSSSDEFIIRTDQAIAGLDW